MVAKNRQAALLYGVQTLYDLGTVGGLSDGELLGLFADGQNERAELAFTALVDRHGPMVLRVCRSVLHDEHDAQDAFQATFLILVRRADLIRKRESVGSWLHGVALRVSACARTALARRRRHEQRAGEYVPPCSGDESESREIAAVIHEELGRLPERYRAAVVLCYLEGLSCAAAAQRLGWPVGTVKSRLSRGRERLLRRLIRRGFGPEESSSDRSARCSLVPSALATETEKAMVQFAAGESTTGLTSARALAWAVSTLRSMQLTWVAAVVAVLCAGIPVIVAAVFATQQPKPAGRHAQATTLTTDGEPEHPAVAVPKDGLVSVRVIDHMGRGVRNVSVHALEWGSNSEIHEYRTGDDGRFRVIVDPRSRTTELHAKTSDRRIGWGRIERERLSFEGTAKDPVTITLVAATRRVEGAIRDSAGKPVEGVKIQMVDLQHEANRSALRFHGERDEDFLDFAVTDRAGRYAILLPENTQATLTARHRRYFGPHFLCAADDGAIAAVTLDDAGGIAGAVIDSSTGKPVANARVAAQLIEQGALRPFRYGLPQGGAGGEASTDASGRFMVDELGPGVFNVLLVDSGRGKRFTARAVEGVRVKAGDEARADLVMIEGRRLHGIVTDFAEGKPMAGIAVQSYNPAHPRSGHWELSTTTDNAGNFELFVPPGWADVYCRGHYQHRTVFADREPDPIRFEKARGLTASYYEKYPESVEVQARIRVRTAMGDGTARNERDLTGRVFDQYGSPIAAVRVAYNREKVVSGATDRLGVFRLKGLPGGPFSLGVNKSGYRPGWTTIPAGAHEVELRLESLPEVVE
jgi:RNA polymerase sigma factor (sigma-70 family)